jgi:integrase
LALTLRKQRNLLGKESQYEAAKQVLEEAGLDSSGCGSCRLRHTFALRQLRHGTVHDQVARRLGVEPDAMDKYRSVVSNPEVIVLPLRAHVESVNKSVTWAYCKWSKSAFNWRESKV